MQTAQTVDAAGSYYVCTQGSEGVGSAGVQVSLVVSLQKADVIVTLRLREEDEEKRKFNLIRKTAKQSVCVAVKENPTITQLPCFLTCLPDCPCLCSDTASSAQLRRPNRSANSQSETTPLAQQKAKHRGKKQIFGRERGPKAEGERWVAMKGAAKLSQSLQ